MIENKKIDLDDDGEVWDAIREEGKRKRWSNFENSLRILKERGIEHKIINASVSHVRVGEWDFWPTTGKFYNAKTKESGRGVFNLIKKNNL